MEQKEKLHTTVICTPNTGQPVLGGYISGAEEYKAYFLSKELRVERVPFYTEDMTLNMLDAIEVNHLERTKRLLSSFAIWKITA